MLFGVYAGVMKCIFFCLVSSNPFWLQSEAQAFYTLSAGKALADVLRDYLDTDAPKTSPIKMLEARGWSYGDFQRTLDAKACCFCLTT